MKYLLIAAILLASCGQSKQQKLEQAKINLRSAEESITNIQDLRKMMVYYVVNKKPYPGKATPDSLRIWDSLAIAKKFYWQSVIDSLNTH